jgi:hypothetical protein
MADFPGCYTHWYTLLFLYQHRKHCNCLQDSTAARGPEKRTSLKTVNQERNFNPCFWRIDGIVEKNIHGHIKMAKNDSPTWLGG